MIALDSQAVESQQLRLGNQTKNFHAGFQRVLKALKKQVAKERLLLLEAGTIRSKRRVIMARRQDIIQKLFNEIDGMSMAEAECYSLHNDFESMRYHHARILTDYVQHTEERLGVQKEKLLLRMTGFAKNVIDDIHEEQSLPRKNKSHSIVFMIQGCTLKLTSDGTLPRVDQIDTLFAHFDSEALDPIVLLNALQLLDMLASQTWGQGKANQREEQRQIVHKLLRLIPYSFTFIRTWSKDNYEVIPMFVAQLFQTLNAVLNILQVLGSISSGVLGTAESTNNVAGKSYTALESTVSMGPGATFGSMTFNHTVSTASNDNSSMPSEHSVYHYSWGSSRVLPAEGTVSAHSAATTRYTDEDLAADVILWLKTLKYVKLGFFQLLSEDIVNSGITVEVNVLNIFCTQDTTVDVESDGRSPRQAWLQEVVVKNLCALLPLGSAITTNILHCAESLTHILADVQAKAAAREAAKEAATAAVAAAAAQAAAEKEAISLGLGKMSSMTNMMAGSQARLVRKTSTVSTGGTEGLGHGTATAAAAAAVASMAASKTPPVSSVPLFGTPAHGLILAALDLAQLSSGRLAVRLGPQGCPTGVATDQLRFLRAADKEVGAALHCAMAAFSYGLLEQTAFNILKHGYDLAVHRFQSYFFVSAWLQCTLAAVLLVIEREVVTEDALNKGSREMINVIRRYEYAKQTAPTKASKLMAPLAGTGVHKAPFLAPHKTPSVLAKQHSVPISRIQDPSLSLPLTSSFFSRQELVTFHSESVLRIITVTAHLRHILTIVHVGMMLVRLLARDLFMKRLRVEEIMEIPLLCLLIPMLDLKSAMELENGKDKDSDGEKAPEKSIQDLSLATSVSNPPSPEASLFEPSVDAFTVGTEASTPTNSKPTTPLDGGGSTMSAGSLFGRPASRGSSHTGGVPLVPQYWKDWTDNNWEKELTDGDGYPSQRMTFVSLLTYVGEAHLQSPEVMEQLLLLVDHLTQKSQVCKFQLVDNGMPLVVHRVLSSQTDNVYMIALSEICSEALEVRV